MRVLVYCRVSTDEQATDAHSALANREQVSQPVLAQDGNGCIFGALSFSSVIGNYA
jgi:DNA invertase Pin-like site-specific DNA recombinase